MEEMYKRPTAFGQRAVVRISADGPNSRTVGGVSDADFAS
jgi:hypothetical protein